MAQRISPNHAVPICVLNLRNVSSTSGSSRGGASRSSVDGPAEGSPHEDTHDEGLVKGKRGADGQPGSPDPRISSKRSQSVAKGSGGTASNGDGGAGGKLASNGTGDGSTPASRPSGGAGQEDGGTGDMEREERKELVAVGELCNRFS